MSLALRAKVLAERLPLPIAKLAVHVPFVVRLGPSYLAMSCRARRVYCMSDGDYHAWALKRLQNILRIAYNKCELYRSRFAACGYDPSCVITLEDFARLPIVSRDELRAVPLQQRVVRSRGRLYMNTGGTSGSPLSFAVDRGSFAREWAHMHLIWERAGYRPSHLKLTLRGRRLPDSEAFRFNPVHNELVVNANVPIGTVIDALLLSGWIRSLRWIHGYPSLVAEFASILESKGSEAVRAVRRNLLGVLLGSEFPSNIYRDKIERILSARVVSWYGHSEMSVLAGESARGIYESLPSYGFTEIVPDVAGAPDGRLVVTSFYNDVHPFIRYDTGDRVTWVDGPNGCPSFRVSSGRVGDFIIDRDGVRHSLTAIIFGRHHASFDLVEHVQVEQIRPGVANLVIVPRSGADLSSVKDGFDLDDLKIAWGLRCVEKPIRTAGGKIALKLCSGSELSDSEDR